LHRRRGIRRRRRRDRSARIRSSTTPTEHEEASE